MTPLRIAIALSCAALAFPWAAQAQDKPLSAQQERMKSCNAEAGGKQLEGAARRDFMSRCLKGESTSGRQLSAQQEKMTGCNRDASAKGLKGDERRSFMRQCLRSAKPSPAAAGR